VYQSAGNPREEAKEFVARAELERVRNSDATFIALLCQQMHKSRLPNIGIIVFLLFFLNAQANREPGSPYGLISQVQTECEAEALGIGTLLADRYNSLDEDTEWDMRLHNDFLVQYLGFAGWIQMGTWKSNGLTSNKQHAPTLHKVNFFGRRFYNASLAAIIIDKFLTNKLRRTHNQQKIILERRLGRTQEHFAQFLLGFGEPVALHDG